MNEKLDENTQDRIAAIARGTTSLIPLVGGILGEVLTAIIPNQRADRIAAYLRELGNRMEALEADVQREILGDKEKIDLIEEGGYQSVRATSDERISRIAHAVFRGLTSDEASIIRRKRLLALLGQVDDDELALLNAYGQAYGGDEDDAWEKVDRPDPAHLGSPIEEIDREALYEAGRDNLLRLGLLKKTFPFLRRGELPEFDPHEGDFKSHREISYLGRMLLREIGLPSAIDTSGGS